MKRCRLSVSPGLQVHIEEHPEGEWVSYEDANAWWQEMKELPRVQDVAAMYEMQRLLKDGAALWHEWRTVDITDDDDRWADFTNRAHHHHDATLAYLKKMGAKP